MARFLCLRLHGPLASWGDIAVGQRRPTAPHPTRSATLGLLAAALGVRRADADALRSLDDSVGFASRTDVPGALLFDFHTAQGPGEKLLRAEEKGSRKAGAGWQRPATRRAELAYPRADLDTLLSQREYRVDALWTAGLWLVPAAPGRWTLDEFVAALRRPRFVPYLGRKSCVLDVPMEPQLVDAGDPVEAMARARFASDDILAAVVERAGSAAATVRWEGTWPGLEPQHTVSRRDRVLARSRWQFTDRLEHQRVWVDAEGWDHVPEQG
jgi:CRISPR system Cascade subunit CasD